MIALSILISLSLGAFGVGKRLANSGQNSVVAQVDQVVEEKFSDYGQQEISGLRVKSLISQLMADGGYVVLVNTVAMRNCQAGEARVTGDLANAIKEYNLVPTNVPMTNSRGVYVDDSADGVTSTSQSYKYLTLFVNYGLQLSEGGYGAFVDENNSAGIKLGATLDKKFSNDNTTANLLEMSDGTFQATSNLMVNEVGTTIFQSRITDFDKEGSTMFIKDGATYVCYNILGATGSYIGTAFVEQLR
jgi:hypothetical protein